MKECLNLINIKCQLGDSSMLVLHKDYHFTTKDIGKMAVLKNFERVKILTVIRENGELHSVYGVYPGFSDLIVWDSKGRSEIPDLDIVMIYDEDNDTRQQKVRNQ